MYRSLRFAFLWLMYTFITPAKGFAQLVVTAQTTPQELVQKLVGDGISISNVTFTGNPLMAGFFKTNLATRIGIDSGIVLTNGRAKSTRFETGVDGNGSLAAFFEDAHNSWGLPGDADLSAAIGGITRDACVLEFDFIPLGDSIKFNYVFSSEEYDPSYVCDYNDAFAFFISGPGFTGSENIALVPNTTTPVSILNVNDVPGGSCPNNTAYYIDNVTNTYFTHDGHTTVLTALAQVQPCQKYHLKLVIADAGNDDDYDSGVFLESKSLTSNAFTLTNVTQTDPRDSSSYLVEGCVNGSVKISRPTPSPYVTNINLDYDGTALNSIDVQTLPSSVVIPAGQTEVFINILPLIDNIPEGIEILNIYTLAPCAVGVPVRTSSTRLQIRDYDILAITPDTLNICRNTTVQLNATSGYTKYSWDANATLNNTTINNPIASPVSSNSKYFCTATTGSCNARDSVLVRWKDIEFVSKKDVNCKDANTGQIIVAAGAEWKAPVSFSLDNIKFQPGGTFNNLPKGNYFIKVKDASGCVDSVAVTLLQAFADMDAAIVNTPASCTGNADGKLVVTTTGGKTPYQYSINNGTTFQASNIFNLKKGTYTVLIKDANNCTFTKSETVLLNDNITVKAGANETICEGTSKKLNAISNGVSFVWSPTNGLTNSTSASPDAAPVVTTKYYVTATKGICVHKDSLIVKVLAAPIPDAGTDIAICYGAGTRLSGAGGTQFTWSPATYLTNASQADTKVNKPLGNITYALNVKDANGCFSLKADSVKITLTPAVRMYAGRDTSVAINQPLQLNAVERSNSGVSIYTWSPSYGLSNASVKSPIAILDRDISYTVTGRTVNDCEGTATINVKVFKGPEIYVPKAFTPNGDGVNDGMRATAIGMKSSRYFTIFNRWGSKIFTTTDFKNGWDGRIKGLQQGNETFIWIAEAVDFKGNIVTRKGTFILLR